MTRTFLLLQLNSEGAAFSDVAEILESVGFRPGPDGHGFVYEWGRSVPLSEILGFADRIQTALKGSRVSFRIESTEE